MRVPELSTPWVAGSNPAGTTPQTLEKTPINKGFFYFSKINSSTDRLEPNGIEADIRGPKPRQSPAVFPALVSLCEITLTAPAMSPAKTLLLAAACLGWIAACAYLVPGWAMP